jgi:uncharacterized damage-inducible protein DinB
MRTFVTLSVLVVLLAVSPGVAQAQEEQQVKKQTAAQQQSQAPPTPQQRVERSWNAVHKKLVDMAEDFPEDKYTYSPAEGVRTFGEVILHVAQVNATVAELTKGREGGFGKIYQELEPDYKYTSKADVVAKLKKSMEDCKGAVEAEDNPRLIGLIEHAGEHYGQLVVYYRSNGMVPPASR